MGESNLHKYLKLMGIKYLDEQGCRLVATEIYIRKSASDLWVNGDPELQNKIVNHSKYLDIDGYESRYKENHDSDSKWIIDVLGIGDKPIMKPVMREARYPDYKPMTKVGEETVIRGVEVKVSRSDFKNGYVQTGLNYHYLLCPELLVKKSEIPKHIGLLYWRGGRETAVYCAKRPVKQELNTDMLVHYREKIYGRYHSQIMGMTREQMRLLYNSINPNDLKDGGLTEK